MEQHNKELRIAVFVLSVFWIIAVILWVRSAVEVDRLETNEYLRVHLQHTVTLPTNDGRLVQSVDIGNGSSGQLRAASDSVFNLKEPEQKKVQKVTRYAKYQQKVSLPKPVTASYTDNAPAQVDTSDCDSLRGFFAAAILTPAEFSYSSDDISLYGFVRKDGVQLDSLSLTNTMHSRDVERKGFARLFAHPETQVYNSNPLWRTDSAAVYRVKQKPNAWNRWIKPTLAAAVAGTAVYMISK